MVHLLLLQVYIFLSTIFGSALGLNFSKMADTKMCVCVCAEYTVTEALCINALRD